MGRRVFRAEPIQPGERGPVSVDFGPAMVLAGEKVPSDNSVTVPSIRERESGADFTAIMLVPGTTSVSNNVATFQVDAPGSDNADYVARVVARTTLARPEEADVIIPVRSRPRKVFRP